jgi:hypothetical protein
MTRDDIIRLARESGGADITSHGWTSWVGVHSTEFLERFAALVAAAEREACAEVAEKELGNTAMLTSMPPKSSAAWNILFAIRARGEV